jgi:hypothetical protein
MMRVSSGMRGNKQDGEKVVELWNAPKWTRAKGDHPKDLFVDYERSP